jgi:putative membrane protein
MRLVWDLLVVFSMCVSLTLYFRGVLRLRARGGSGTGIQWYESTAFLLGWATICAALLGPVDTLSDILFSVHMTQHELLMLVAAPLLIAGRPMIAGLWGLPDAAREATARIVRKPSVKRSWQALTNPVFVLLLHGVVLWSWHIPAAFEWALHNESVHAMQHLMFFLTAALFWWSIVQGRYGRVGYGAAVFFVFATGLHTGILGALLTFAGHLWYPSYAHTAPHALQDQQLAGLIMWIPAGTIFLLIGLALFAAWMGESERRARAGSAAIPLMLVAVLILNGCFPSDRRSEARQLTGGGDPDRGKTALRRYGCGSCHSIPGVLAATATVGPPLDKLAMRSYLAGRIDNTPTNLIRWIRDPKSIDQKTAMPDVGVTDDDAKDMAAYLLTLK